MTDKAYTTEEKIEAYLGISIATGGASSAILAAQSYIDNYTGKNFKADTEASVRYYNGNDRNAILIDDCVEIEKVEIGNNEWGDSYSEIADSGIDRYIPLPWNYEANGVPINKIGLRNRIFLCGEGNQKITAKWGYSVNVPDDICFASTVIASGIY